jgi:hypothetical protein
MTYIAPLPREAISDPELRALMAEGEALGVPDDLFPRLVARAPEQAVPLMRALQPTDQKVTAFKGFYRF